MVGGGIILALVGFEAVVDGGLTNGTGWVMEGMEFARGRGAYYLADREGRLTSPEFRYNITSVVVEVMHTSTRNCLVVPLDAAGNEQPSLSRELLATSSHSPSRVEWGYDDQVRRLRFKSSAGRGSYYLYSISILGEAPILPPSRLSAFPRSISAFLSWLNPAPAVSNRLDLSYLYHLPASYIPSVSFSFSSLSNTTYSLRPINFSTTTTSSSLSALSGTRLYLPTNSVGILQLSSARHRGSLLLPPQSVYSNLTLSLVAAHVPSDQSTLSVAYLANSAATTTIATLTLSTAFTTNYLSLASLPTDSSILLNHAGNETHHRIHLRSVSLIRDYCPAHTVTNPLPSYFPIGESSLTLRLAPATDYLATLTAFDEYGNLSDPTPPLEFSTLPLTGNMVIVR